MIKDIWKLLRSDRGISSRPYERYFVPSSIILVAITAAIYAYQNGVILDALQQILIFSCMALGYDYFSGYTGSYNLGYGAFVAIGSYVLVFSSNAGWPIPLAMLFGGVVAALFALAMSYPFLRLRGGYFAIATLVLILILQAFDTNLPQYTRGSIGVILNYPGTLLATPLLVASLAITLASLYFHLALGKSKLGLALLSVKEDEEVSESLGVNAFRVKQVALILSAFFGGISGGLFAMYLGFINSDNTLGLGTGLLPVVAAMAGGSGIYLGPIIGTFILTVVRILLPNVIVSINPSVHISPTVTIGVLLLLVGLFMPGGLLKTRRLLKYSENRTQDKGGGITDVGERVALGRAEPSKTPG